MALQKEFTTGQGFYCPVAYIIITEIFYMKENNSQCKIVAFKDKEARHLGMEELFSRNISFRYDVESELNLVEQAYMAVKNNIDFLDCIDV